MMNLNRFIFTSASIFFTFLATEMLQNLPNSYLGYAMKALFSFWAFAYIYVISKDVEDNNQYSLRIRESDYFVEIHKVGIGDKHPDFPDYVIRKIDTKTGSEGIWHYYLDKIDDGMY